MNNMRSVKEKEKIIKFYLSGHGLAETKRKYSIEHDVVFYRWLRKYQNEGIDGLISKTGKHISKSTHKGLHLRKPKNKNEELELELMKKDIEIARLKKGYIVKGGGTGRKVFVTFSKKNTK